MLTQFPIQFPIQIPLKFPLKSPLPWSCWVGNNVCFCHWHCHCHAPGRRSCARCYARRLGRSSSWTWVCWAMWGGPKPSPRSHTHPHSHTIHSYSHSHPHTHTHTQYTHTCTPTLLQSHTSTLVHTHASILEYSHTQYTPTHSHTHNIVKLHTAACLSNTLTKFSVKFRLKSFCALTLSGCLAVCRCVWVTTTWWKRAASAPSYSGAVCIWWNKWVSAPDYWFSLISSRVSGLARIPRLCRVNVYGSWDQGGHLPSIGRNQGLHITIAIHMG